MASSRKTITEQQADPNPRGLIVAGATCAPYKLSHEREYLAWLSHREAMTADAARAGFDLVWFIALEGDPARPEWSGMADRVDERWFFTLNTGATRIDGNERLVRICTGRNLITEYALRRNADWILFLDTDLTPAPDTVSKLLALNWPIVGGEVPGYCLSGPEIPEFARVGRWGGIAYGFPVQAHWNTAGYLMVHRDLYRKLRWRIDPPSTDDPCYAADAVQLGFPTLVRKDLIGDHLPLVPVEERGHSLDL